MAASTDKSSSRQPPPTAHRLSNLVSRTAPSRIQPKASDGHPQLIDGHPRLIDGHPQLIDGQPQVHLHNIRALQERRCRRRAAVLPMYSSVQIRLIATREPPMDAHVLDLSETGMAIELDFLLPIGTAVTIEFRVAGLGRLHHDQWSELSAAAQVVRHDNLDDFPAGPYKLGLRFVRISTMTKANIARFIAIQPG